MKCRMNLFRQVILREAIEDLNMRKTDGLTAFIWLLGAGATLAAPEGLYRGPGYFPGYYGGYLYGYHPGPSLPLPGDESINCVDVFIADRQVWKGGGFVSSPLMDKACRAEKQLLRDVRRTTVLKR